ncbi:MAG: hypothetical protein IPG63_18000 [Xanthomonadales bacterium]|nr:hypothetical protein [Xanthomonadales bacterium]
MTETSTHALGLNFGTGIFPMPSNTPICVKSLSMLPRVQALPPVFSTTILMAVNETLPLPAPTARSNFPPSTLMAPRGMSPVGELAESAIVG